MWFGDPTWTGATGITSGVLNINGYTEIVTTTVLTTTAAHAGGVQWQQGFQSEPAVDLVAGNAIAAYRDFREIVREELREEMREELLRELLGESAPARHGRAIRLRDDN